MLASLERLWVKREAIKPDWSGSVFHAFVIAPSQRPVLIGSWSQRKQYEVHEEGLMHLQTTAGVTLSRTAVLDTLSQ